MESYEDFIQRHSNTHNDEDEPQTPITPSSVIVFHGAGVLPPLLNEHQRDEMRRLRETAVSLMMKKRREEESHISFTDVRISDAGRHTDRSHDITDCDITSSAPLTSTAHDGQSANQLRTSPEDDSLENTQITVLFKGHKLQRPDDRSHDQTATMMSSGYVTNDNTDVTGRLDTTRSGSDIISHAPVDGMVLEEETAAPLLKSESVPSEPYRTSLQNLLKQSQEYRRRQRLLRSQARATEEHSLSDKENEELLPKQTWKTEQRKEKEDADVTSDSKQRPAARFTSIPMPKFCLSPVRCKKRSRIPGPLRKASGKPAPHTAMMSSQTEQIAQLELNLSSLKALISDLESTLTLSQTSEVHPKPPSEVTSSETVTARDCGLWGENASSRSPGEAGSFVMDSSYDVDVPSDLWKQLTPEAGGQEVMTRVKRRLLMNEDEAFGAGPQTGDTLSSTPRGLQSSAQTQEDQVTALMEEERRQQQELLQSLAERYQFLRSVSFLCPSADSRLEDTLTSITPSSVCTHTELTDTRSRPSLLTAVVRGFLTRRLLRTERVSRLVRTITDSSVFLQSFQSQAVSSRHELMLQERVTLQLREARWDLHHVFFSSSCSDRMKMIRCDRELSRERRLTRVSRDHKVKGSLSAATRKALERKKLLLQRKSADRKKFSPSSEEKWNLVPKICRVSKKMAFCGAR